VEKLEDLQPGMVLEGVLLMWGSIRTGWCTSPRWPMLM
jgi:hypothetical protein